MDPGTFQSSAAWATILAHQCAAERQPSARRKLFKEYLVHLGRAARDAAKDARMQAPMRTALDLATNPAWRSYGGPWIVGDVRPVNVGLDREGRGVCFDLQFLAPVPEGR